MRPPTCNFQAALLSIGLGLIAASAAWGQPVPGGSLDPTTIPKYVTPLVIPPVMNNTGTVNDYEIAVRQFQQQILPGGIWNTLNGRNDQFNATTVWSYGPAGDPQPDSSSLGGMLGVAPAPNSQFNYPAYTVEATVNVEDDVDWINHLVKDPWSCNWQNPSRRGSACNYIPHLTAIDRSLHWANPEKLRCTDPDRTIDCRPDPSNGSVLTKPYTGPVPIVTHLHGSHADARSDGYPEAWWLPAANNIPNGYATQGTLVNQYGTPTNTQAGVGSFSYRNDQPSTTLWYHDHTLGMTRNNVYAGPAGFWLIRESGGGETGLVSGTLPSPAPKLGETLAQTNFPASLGGQREKYREIPIVIQDRSFNSDGSLFYPDNRAFFEGINPGQLAIPFIGSDGSKKPSDISAIWNPEAFFNVMVVNGVAWPSLDVARDLYRFRLLNGCNSRFLNLAMFVVNPDGTLGQEVPFYQIGAEQGLLPQVVQVKTGFKTALAGNGNIPSPTPAAAADEALLMGLAERADVLVDFTGLPAGTVVRMINTAPDAPFGGFPDVPADPSTTGQVMEFHVTAEGASGFTPPQSLVLSLPDPGDPANTGPLPGPRDMALLEEESALVCVRMAPNGTIKYDKNARPAEGEPETCRYADDTLAPSVPFGPREAVLGVNGATTEPTVTLWSSPLATNPELDSTETWELWNWTADAHPIHLHLVKFKVVNREPFDPDDASLLGPRDPEATEAGWKDTVIAYPGEVTRVNATFDIAGLYVWHCHIVEHEDNEMMVPYCVGDRQNAPGCGAVD